VFIAALVMPKRGFILDILDSPPFLAK